MKMLGGLAAISGFSLISTDVPQAYLKSAKSMNRDTLITPPKDFYLSQDELIKLLKPWYGFLKSGYYRGRAFRPHLEMDLSMKNKVYDAALLYRN